MMGIELIIIGVIVGIISGFFGIGGGMILVPILLLIGFDINTAVGISIIQMVFTSVYGSYLNYKKGSLEINDGIFIGIGGFIGGFGGSLLTPFISSETLKYLFVFIILFAILKLVLSKEKKDETVNNSISWVVLLIIGVIIGVFAITLGIGGSVMLTPILAGILHYPIKKAISAGLFFVVFSSMAGLIGRVSSNNIDLENGLIIAISSLFGVFIGIFLKDYITSKNHKYLLILLYLITLFMMIKKMWF
jgi:uncharacterized membrane protein YfcA